MKKFLTLLFWAYLGLILLFSIIPSLSSSNLNLSNFDGHRLDYFLHAIAFFLIPIIGYLAMGSRQMRKTWWYYIIASFTLAVGTEYLQHYVPGRSFNPLDIYSNVMGLIVGVIAVLIFARFYNRKYF